MTKEQAINLIRYRIDTATEIAGKGADGKVFEDLEIAIKALEELNLYEENGLCLIPSDVYEKQCEELDRLKEMTNPEKPVILEYKLLTNIGWIYGCPNCGSAIGVNKYHIDITQPDDWCPTCGKAIDWS